MPENWWEALAEEFSLAKGDEEARPSDNAHSALTGSLGELKPALVHRLVREEDDVVEFILATHDHRVQADESRLGDRDRRSLARSQRLRETFRRWAVGSR